MAPKAGNFGVHKAVREQKILPTTLLSGIQDHGRLFFLGKKSLWSSLLASGRLLFFRKKIPMVGYYRVVAHLFFHNTIFSP